MKLYTFFRSSAAYRVRIALNLKQLTYQSIPVHLTKNGGQQHQPEYRAVNPQMRVPALRLDGDDVLTQSLAIIEYLDETYAEPPLLPEDPLARARVRAMAQLIACDIHPLNNTSPLRYLRNVLGHKQEEIDAWYHHWIIEGFTALEQFQPARPISGVGKRLRGHGSHAGLGPRRHRADGEKARRHGHPQLAGLRIVPHNGKRGDRLVGRRPSRCNEKTHRHLLHALLTFVFYPLLLDLQPQLFKPLPIPWCGGTQTVHRSRAY